MLERILGPSVKYDTKTKTGTIKLRTGQSFEIKATGHTENPQFNYDIFRLSSKGQDAADIHLHSQSSGKKEIYNGSVHILNLFEKTQDFIDSGLKFLSMKDQKAIGKKLAKRLGKKVI